MKRYLLIITILFVGALAPDLLAKEPAAGNRHWNASKGYSPFSYATTEGIAIDNTTPFLLTDSYAFPEPCKDFELIFRGANLHGHPDKKYEISHNGKKFITKNINWGFFLTTLKGDTLKVEIGKKEIADAFSSSMKASVNISVPGKEPENLFINDRLNLYTGFNQWRIIVGNGSVRIKGGDHKEFSIFESPLPSCEFTGFGFFATPGASVRIKDISLLLPDDDNPFTRSAYTLEAIEEIIDNSYDATVGYYTVFDRSLEENLLRMGGDYRFAIIPDEEEGDNYLIIYLSGAVVNSNMWQPGMIKGRLMAEPFPDIYNLVWIDSEGKALSNGIKAQIEDDGLISIQFPYHSSTLRLRKFISREQQ